MRIRILLAALAITAAAQELPEFSGWMKDQDKAMKALRQSESKTGAEAVKNAETLAAVYENMIGFWRQRNAADAVKWSEQGKAAAVALASAAFAGKGEAAAQAFREIGGGCKTCHEAYRTKLPNGHYAIQERPMVRGARKKK